MFNCSHICHPTLGPPTKHCALAAVEAKDRQTRRVLTQPGALMGYREVRSQQREAVVMFTDWVNWGKETHPKYRKE